jgi:hypothetical protein
MSTSLRLWEGIDFCYATNQKSPPPTFVKDYKSELCKGCGNKNQQ